MTYFKIFEFCAKRFMQKFNCSSNNQTKIYKISIGDRKISIEDNIKTYWILKEFFLMFLQEEMNSFLLFKQPFLFNAYTTAVASSKHSLDTGLLPSAIGLYTLKWVWKGISKNTRKALRYFLIKTVWNCS